MFSLTTIPKEILSAYKAAGVLPYAVHNNRIYLLLGGEDRSRKGDGKEVWHHFGGKRDAETDSFPQDTAIRELHEETGGLLVEQLSSISQTLYNLHSFKFWLRSGKYVFFVVEVDYIVDISTKFRALDRNNLVENDQVDLQWVPCMDVVNAIKENSGVLIDGGEKQFYRFFVEIMGKHDVIGHLEQLAASNNLE